jgi:hypothetical protein
MANTPNVSSAVSLIYPLIKGASPVVADLAAYTFARKFFSTKTSYAAASLAGVAALVVLCSSTQKQVLNSGLLYLTYKVLLLVLNYRSSSAKSKTAIDPHTSTSSSNGSRAASSPPPITEPAPGASASDASTTRTDTPASSNGSGAASSHSSSEELAPGASASASDASTTGTDTPASSNGSGAASSHSSSKEEPALGSSSSNASGAASSPPPAIEPAPGSSSASATPPPSSVPTAAPQSPRRGASQPQSNGDANTSPPSPFNAFPASPSTSPAARPADLSASSSSSSAAAASARPRSLEERKEAVQAIRTRFEALAERFTFTFNGKLPNLTSANTGDEILAELHKQDGFKRAELDVKARSQWSANTQEFGLLIIAAANEMRTSLSEIELETQHIADPEERKKAVAERLNNDPSINPVTYRTLPYIYSFVRQMKGIIHCPSVDHKLLSERRKIIYSPTLTSSDKEAFYQEGTGKNGWRKLYNETIAAYNPYLSDLNSNLRKWLVQDDGKTKF